MKGDVRRAHVAPGRCKEIWVRARVEVRVRVRARMRVRVTVRVRVRCPARRTGPSRGAAGWAPAAAPG